MNALNKPLCLLILIFLSITAKANVFTLPKTSARFELSITQEKLSYKSEHMQKTIKVEECNLKMIKDLNNSLLSQTPLLVSNGLDYQIDDVAFQIHPQDPFAKRLLSMDERMMGFLLLERHACKR